MMSYEERIQDIKQKGLEINYPKLKFLYKKLGIPQDKYKEPKDQEFIKKESLER